MKLDVPLPEGAEERAWQVVRAAYEERVPAPRERKVWRPVVVLAAAAVAAGAIASPPGQAVLDSIREAVGVERAQPALFSLPTAGRLLVESADGVWVVQADGSKRRLGDWREASWSPFGRFVVVARTNELAALEPDGDVHWSIARPKVRFPRWAGDRIDTRIAYLSGTSLRVVAGDGTGDRLLRRNVAAVPPAWLPGEGFRLAYTDLAGRTVVVDADTGRVLRERDSAGSPQHSIRRRGAASEVVARRPGGLPRDGRVPRRRPLAGRTLAARHVADGRPVGVRAHGRAGEGSRPSRASRGSSEAAPSPGSPAGAARSLWA